MQIVVFLDHTMEKFLTKINSRILDLKYQGISAWTFILKSKVTLSIILIVMIAILTYLNYLFYEILFKPLWIIFLLTTIFILVTVLLPGFLLVGGTDIYKNMRDLKDKAKKNDNHLFDKVEPSDFVKTTEFIEFNSSTHSDEIIEKSKMTINEVSQVNDNCDVDFSIINLDGTDITETNVIACFPASNELIRGLFEHLQDKNFFDRTLIRRKLHINSIEIEDVFKFEYFKDFINDIRCNGETTKRLYLLADQKTVGFLIFEAFKPILKRDVSKISEYFYYYQIKNGFKPINYDSIISPSKRSVHPPTHKFLPIFFSKFRSDL